MGLDYYWDNEPHEIQKKWFIRQLDLARELDLPVMIHSRSAAADTMEIMKEHGQGLRGIIHCYSYSLEMAKEYVKMGYHIGIGGVVTFKNGKKLKEVAEAIPLESIVPGNGLSVYGSGTIPRQAEQLFLHSICGRGDQQTERDYGRRSDPSDGRECEKAVIK